MCALVKHAFSTRAVLSDISPKHRSEADSGREYVRTIKSVRTGSQTTQQSGAATLPSAVTGAAFCQACSWDSEKRGARRGRPPKGALGTRLSHGEAPMDPLAGCPRAAVIRGANGLRAERAGGGAAAVTRCWHRPPARGRSAELRRRRRRRRAGGALGGRGLVPSARGPGRWRARGLPCCEAFPRRGLAAGGGAERGLFSSLPRRAGPVPLAGVACAALSWPWPSGSRAGPRWVSSAPRNRLSGAPSAARVKVGLGGGRAARLQDGVTEPAQAGRR